MPGVVRSMQGDSRQMPWNAAILLATIGRPEASAQVIAPDAESVASR